MVRRSNLTVGFLLDALSDHLRFGWLEFHERTAPAASRRALYMPREGRYECEYVDAKGKAHDMSLLVTSGDKVWLYDTNGKALKPTGKDE